MPGGQRLADAVGAADHHRQEVDQHGRHVIICGYGRSGQNLARMLEQEHIPYMALDLDPDRCARPPPPARAWCSATPRGCTSLMAAGLARASAVVISYHDTPSALKVLHLVRSMRPGAGGGAHLDDSDLEKLRAPAPPRWCPRPSRAR
jgi:CPA2 family monovalent cation:H+ antiporter-2